MRKCIILFILSIFIITGLHCTSSVGSMVVVQSQPSKTYLEKTYGRVTFGGHAITEEDFPRFIEGIKELIIMNDRHSDLKKKQLISEWEKVPFEKNRIFSWMIISSKLVYGKDLRLKFNIIGQDNKSYLGKSMKASKSIIESEMSGKRYGNSWLIISRVGLSEKNVGKQPYYLVVTFPNKQKVKYSINMKD